MIEAMDDNVGKVISTLREIGELENSIIVFTSDNGGVSKFFKAGLQALGFNTGNSTTPVTPVIVGDGARSQRP